METKSVSSLHSELIPNSDLFHSNRGYSTFYSQKHIDRINVGTLQRHLVASAHLHEKRG